jgi:ABC-type sugar transport system ATPase subunit
LLHENKPLIELIGIVKSFPGVRALKGVSLSVLEGELHALCGENGAGKSTLIKILAGAHQKDEGRILIDGQEIQLSNTREAINLGINCIYQELSIVPLLDVANNLYLGNLPMKGRLIDYKKLYADSEALLAQLNMNISPRAIAGGLSVGQQQMIEIGRALTRKARLIIMDEPTSSLSEKETNTLFEICGNLKDRNIAVIYISHKLDEVMKIAARVTVIRDGENIITKNIGEISRDEIISSMIGRTLETMYGKQKADHGDVVFDVRNLSRKGVFEDISFEVHAGEILGFFGLVGSGRSEIMRAAFGVDDFDSGEVYLLGKRLRRKNPAAAIRQGLAFATEDRKKEGLMLWLSILINMTLVRLKELSFAGVVDIKKQNKITLEYIESMEIKTPSEKTFAVKLSGGNQQKIVLAKWLMMKPRVLIVDEPTRGIDVGSKAAIYRLINSLVGEGVAIILVSSEIEEVMGLSDRIVVIAEGKKKAHFEMNEALTREEILSAAI